MRFTDFREAIDIFEQLGCEEVEGYYSDTVGSLDIRKTQAPASPEQASRLEELGWERYWQGWSLDFGTNNWRDL